jgi:hypothetical protein
MSQTLDEVKPLVDKTLEGLAKQKFPEDPLLGAEYSRRTSIAASAQRRHGLIIEAAFRSRLCQVPGLEVWDTKEFAVSSVADSMVNAEKNPLKLLDATVTYGEQSRKLQVDAFVHDPRRQTLASYELKRGGASHDSGKTRSMFRDLLCTQVLLKSYGQSLGLRVKSAKAHIVFYYGRGSIPKPWALTRDDLNAHFGADITSDIEAVNEYFREQLIELVDGRLASPIPKPPAPTRKKPLASSQSGAAVVAPAPKKLVWRLKFKKKASPKA